MTFQYCFALFPKHCELCGRRFWPIGYRHSEDRDRWRCCDCQRRVMWVQVVEDMRRAKNEH